MDSRQNVQVVYQLSKQMVDGKCIYGERGHNRIVDECMYLLKYLELVLIMMMREKAYEKPVYL